MLFFLKDQIYGRKTNGSSTELVMKQDYSFEELQCTQSESLTSTSTHEGLNVTATHSAPKVPANDTSASEVSNASQPPMKRKKQEASQTDFPRLEEEKVDILRKREEEDDDYRQFMLSLVPSMKLMDPKKQCLFRLKVQHLVYEALHGDN